MRSSRPHRPCIAPTRAPLPIHACVVSGSAVTRRFRQRPRPGRPSRWFGGASSAEGDSEGRASLSGRGDWAAPPPPGRRRPPSEADSESESRLGLSQRPGRGHPDPRPRPRPRLVRGRGPDLPGRPRFARGRRGRSPVQLVPVPDLLKSGPDAPPSPVPDLLNSRTLPPGRPPVPDLLKSGTTASGRQY